MDLKAKSEELSKKFNRITNRFKQNLDIATDLECSGKDLMNCVEAKTVPVEPETLSDQDLISVIDFDNLVQDFAFIRKTLKENTENGKKILNSVTCSLLDEDSGEESNLIMAFAELNRALTDNMKLYIQSYKDISNIIMNVSKVKTLKTNVTNNLNINNINNNDIQPIISSTAELIKKIQSKQD